MVLEIKIEDLENVDSKISAILKPEMLDLIRNEIIKRTSLRRFSIEMGLGLSFIPNLLNGWIRSTRLKILRRMAERLNIKLEDILKAVIAKNNSKSFILVESFPIKESADLASLIGRTFGDGCIGPISFSYTNKNRELITDTTRKVMTLPVKNVNLNERYYKAISVQYAKLVRNILIAFGAPVGNKTNQQLYVPKWVKEGSFEIKTSFIQALFDDEATVCISSREIILGMKKRIDIIDNLTNFLVEIKSILNELGINGTSVNNGNDYTRKDGTKTKEKRLRICGIVNLKNFKKKIGFLSSRKNKLLDKIIQLRQCYLLKKYSSKIKIIQLLKTKEQLSTSELAKEIGKNRRITCDNLRDLEKLGKVIRIRNRNKTKPDTWFLNSKI